MPAELVDLRTAREECRASVIETLAEAMDRAVAGNIVAVAIAFVTPDGAINTSRSQSDNVGTLLGAVTLLQGRLLAKIEGRS